MRGFISLLTGGRSKERGGRRNSPDLSGPQFTREGWEDYVAACTRALDKAFSDGSWSSYVDQGRGDPGIDQGQGEEDDFYRQSRIAVFCYSAEAILFRAEPEEKAKAEALHSYLFEELRETFPQHFADGRVPMTVFPKSPTDFREG